MSPLQTIESDKFARQKRVCWGEDDCRDDCTLRMRKYFFSHSFSLKAKRHFLNPLYMCFWTTSGHVLLYFSPCVSPVPSLCSRFFATDLLHIPSNQWLSFSASVRRSLSPSWSCDNEQRYLISPLRLLKSLVMTALNKKRLQDKISSPAWLCSSSVERCECYTVRRCGSFSGTTWSPRRTRALFTDGPGSHRMCQFASSTAFSDTRLPFDAQPLTSSTPTVTVDSFGDAESLHHRRRRLDADDRNNDLDSDVTAISAFRPYSCMTASIPCSSSTYRVRYIDAIFKEFSWIWNLLHNHASVVLSIVADSPGVGAFSQLYTSSVSRKQ